MVIPKPVRDAMGIRPGDDVYFRVEKGQVILETKTAKELLEEFINAVPKKYKRKIKGPIDWHAIQDEQYEERLGKFLR